MRIPFFSKKNGQDRGLHFKNSNITGDVSIDSVGEGSDAIGVDLFNSNITGNITINYNGGTEALEEKIDSILHNLRDTMEKQHPNEVTTFANDFDEVQNVVNQNPEVPSAIDSMRKLARVLYKTGYYDEATQAQIDIAELMMETDNVVSQIHGIIHLCQHDKSVDWYDHLRKALKLAVENDLKKEEYTVHFHLFESYFYYYNGANTYTLQRKSKRLLDNIIRDASRMGTVSFADAYAHCGYSKGDIVHAMIRYMNSWESEWKKPDERQTSKRLFQKFDYMIKDTWHNNKFYRAQKFEILHPRISTILDIPGMILWFTILLITFTKYEPDWTLSSTKSWAFTIIVAIGVWYFLI